ALTLMKPAGAISTRPAQLPLPFSQLARGTPTACQKTQVDSAERQRPTGQRVSLSRSQRAGPSVVVSASTPAVLASKFARTRPVAQDAARASPHLDDRRGNTAQSTKGR